MPKFRYNPPVTSKKEEKFFDFRDVQTRPAKWSGRTSNQLYEWTPTEIYEAGIRRDKKKRLKEEKELEENRLHR